MAKENYFTKLNKVDVNGHTEDRQGFTYLSWAYAQEVLGKHHEDAVIEVREYGEFGFPYLETPVGYFVQVIVTINGVRRGRPFAVTDSANRPLGAEYWDKKQGKMVMNRKPTSFDINTSIQRAFVKACAEHGLGLYIYEGADEPTDNKQEKISALQEKLTEARKNEKINDWLKGKEVSLGKQMVEWELDVLETYWTKVEQSLAKLEKEEEEKPATEEKPKEEKKKSTSKKKKEAKEEEKPAEETNALGLTPEDGMPVYNPDEEDPAKMIEFIRDACQYANVKAMAKEYTAKMKASKVSDLQPKFLKILYNMSNAKRNTALQMIEEQRQKEKKGA